MTKNVKLKKLSNLVNKLNYYSYDIAIECSTHYDWYKADSLIQSIKFEIEYGQYNIAKASAKKLLKYIPNNKRIRNLLNNVIYYRK